MYTCGLDMSGFDRCAAETLRAQTDGIHRAVENAAQDGAREAQNVGQFKDHTGDLRSHIRADNLQESTLTATWKIVSPEPYSIFVEAGTKPHEIPGNPLLKFYWPKVGAWVALPKVNHPGGRPFPFMGPGALKAERVLIRDLEVMRAKMSAIWRA